MKKAKICWVTMIYFLKTFQLQIKLQEQIQIWLILQKKKKTNKKKWIFKTRNSFIYFCIIDYNIYIYNIPLQST